MKIQSTFILCILFNLILFNLAFTEEQILCPDLEEYTCDFVIETRQINIPDHPNAFNASIIRWEGRLLMGFRDEIIAAPLSIYENSGSSSHFYLVWLDDNFDPISPVQEILIKSQLEDQNFYPIQDARLIAVNHNLYMIYNGYLNPYSWVSRISITKLHHDNHFFHVIHNEQLHTFEEESVDRAEKNWVPFINEDQLYLAYGLSPHRILRPLLNGTGIAQTIGLSYPSIVWEWGELRGGTPGLVIDNQNYLSFFHSAKWDASAHSDCQNAMHYYIGAYLFEQQWPFKIKKISPEPIVGENFYHGKSYEPYWKPIVAVFPCGFIIENEVIWLTYGRQDHEIWLAKIDKKRLLESLIRVSNLSL